MAFSFLGYLFSFLETALRFCIRQTRKVMNLSVVYLTDLVDATSRNSNSRFVELRLEEPVED